MLAHIEPLPASDDPTPAELIAARPALSMHAMDGLLFDGVPLNAIADAVGTPTWVYAAPVMRARYHALAGTLAAAGLDAHVHYAVKANDHLAVLDLFAREGAGADVVSEGELRRALHAGIPASRIVFSGVGKSVAELRLALEADIAQINVESAEELAMLSSVAAGMGRTARVALRVNPDVDAGDARQDQRPAGRATSSASRMTRSSPATPGPPGCRISARSVLPCISAARSPRWRPIAPPIARIAALVAALRQAGHAVETVDCGGGLGVAYRDQPEGKPAALAGAIAGAFHGLDLRLMVEPGRWLVAPAGLLLGTGGAGEARRQRPLRRARCGDERPAAPGDVRGVARHRPGLRGRCARQAQPHRHRGPGLRNRRHLRAQPAPAAGRDRTRAWRSSTPAPMVR